METVVRSKWVDEYTGKRVDRLVSKKTHKDLDVWKLSIQLVKAIYKLTSEFPSEEKFGLISQIRSAAISVPSNVARPVK